jgi:hypothetical protein
MGLILFMLLSSGCKEKRAKKTCKEKKNGPEVYLVPRGGAVARAREQRQ